MMKAGRKSSASFSRATCGFIVSSRRSSGWMIPVGPVLSRQGEAVGGQHGLECPLIGPPDVAQGTCGVGRKIARRRTGKTREARRQRAVLRQTEQAVVRLRGAAPNGGRIVRPRAPAAVRTPFVRNAVTPTPIAPLVAPVVAVPAAAAALGNEFEGRRRVTLG